MNKAALSIRVHIFLWTCFYSLCYIGVEFYVPLESICLALQDIIILFSKASSEQYVIISVAPCPH